MYFKHVKKLLVVLLIAFIPAVAQTSATTDAAEAQKHLITHVDPVYPAIAKAAQVQGDVVLQVSIAKDGKVTTVKAVSGPPMLLQAATDAVKNWQYTPFEDAGSLVAVSTTVTVPFTLGIPVDSKDEEIAKAYFPLSMKCIQLVGQRADPA